MTPRTITGRTSFAKNIPLARTQSNVPNLAANPREIPFGPQTCIDYATFEMRVIAALVRQLPLRPLTVDLILNCRRESL